MKKGISLIIVILFALILSGCAKKPPQNQVFERVKLKQEIVVGVKVDSKPFGFMQNGEPQGFDVDVAKAVGRHMFGDEKRVKLVPVTAQNRISALNSHEVDMVIATMSINESRSEVVDFTTPYYVAGQAIMVKNGSKIKNISELNDKNVVIVLGTTGERALRQLAPNASITGSINYTDAFEKLKNNDVQAVFADDSILYGFAMDNKGFKILPKRYTREYYAIAIDKNENPEFKNLLNAILGQMQEDGELYRIRQKWTPQGILQG